MFCCIFNFYENIAEAVPQTRTAVAVAQNSNRTGTSSNGSYKNGNKGPPGGAMPRSPSVCFVLSLIVMKTLMKLFHRHEKLSLSPGTATEPALAATAVTKMTMTGPGALRPRARQYAFFCLLLL